MRIATRVLPLVLVVVLAAGCSGDGSQDKAPDVAPVKGVTEVSMKNLKFNPPAIQVPVGTTVTWKFDDGSIPHNVKGDGYSSKTTATGTFTHRFDKAGTFEYRCDLHADMKGRVVVG
jgi:plastocyanin